MIVYTLLATTLLVAVLALRMLYRAMRRYIGDSWHALLLGLSIAWLAYLYGTWVYLTVYAKYVFAALVPVAIVAGAMRSKRSYKPGTAKRFANVLFSTLFIAMCILYYTGIEGEPQTVALQFPLRTGRYFILQGGKGLPANLFHYTYRGAIYAIDIVKLDKSGNRARSIFSSRLEDYHIFNDTVYSPCSGRIINMRNDNPDNVPPSREKGPSNLNAIVIEADSFYIFLGHLKKGSVLVAEGEPVRAGEPLAQVGNSGFSLEPHLHIQAHTKAGGRPWYRGEPLYIEFDGKVYLLFETITPKKVEMVSSP